MIVDGLFLSFSLFDFFILEYALTILSICCYDPDYIDNSDDSDSTL